MRLLANENFPQIAVESLRGGGHDVVWVRTDMPGADDATLLARAGKESRLVVTFDKDFGELAFRSRLPAESGVILFRFALRSPEFVAERVLTVVKSRTDWRGKFAVAEESRIRVRSLPVAGR